MHLRSTMRMIVLGIPQSYTARFPLILDKQSAQAQIISTYIGHNNKVVVGAESRTKNKALINTKTNNDTSHGEEGTCHPDHFRSFVSNRGFTHNRSCINGHYAILASFHFSKSILSSSPYREYLLACIHVEYM